MGATLSLIPGLLVWKFISHFVNGAPPPLPRLSRPRNRCSSPLPPRRVIVVGERAAAQVANSVLTCSQREYLGIASVMPLALFLLIESEISELFASFGVV